MKDDSKMPYGKYSGQRMIDVPASYLLWLYDNNKCSGEVKKYIQENIDVLRSEVK